MTSTSRARYVAGYFELFCGDMGLPPRDRLRLAKVADLAVRDYYQQDPKVLYDAILARVFAAICRRPSDGPTRFGRVFTIKVVSDDLACYIDDGLREAGIPELIALAAGASRPS